MGYSTGEILLPGSLNSMWRSIGSIVLSADKAAGDTTIGTVSGFPLAEFNQFRITGRLFFSGANGVTFGPRLIVNNTNGNIVNQYIDGVTTTTEVNTSTFIIRPLVSSGGQAWFQAHVSKGVGTGSHHFYSMGNELNWLGYKAWGCFGNSADIGSLLIGHDTSPTLIWKSGTAIYFEGKST